jgi:hypothetical protein
MAPKAAIARAPFSPFSSAFTTDSSKATNATVGRGALTSQSPATQHNTNDAAGHAKCTGFSWFDPSYLGSNNEPQNGRAEGLKRVPRSASRGSEGSMRARFIKGKDTYIPIHYYNITVLV